MKKKILLTVVFGLTAVCTMAQKVYKEGAAIVLDLSEGAGMPAGVVTTDSKQFPPTTATNGNSAWSDDNVESVLTKGLLNQTVYHKLEVAPNYMNTTGAMDGTGSLLLTWADAVEGCRGSMYDGGGWRLPTQRELWCMWLCREAIVSLSGVPWVYVRTWSITEEKPGYAWATDAVDRGRTGNRPIGKTLASRVRCVREL